MEKIETRLKRLGDLHRVRVAEGIHATKKLQRTIQEAAKAGMPKTEIARLTGLSRQTVYNAIKTPVCYHAMRDEKP